MAHFAANTIDRRTVDRPSGDKPTSETPQRVAVFDFDQTLIEINSLGVLFKQVSGRRRLWPLVFHLLGQGSTYARSPRLSIKTELYKRCLGGRAHEVLIAAAEDCAMQLKIIEPALQSLFTLARDDHHIWIATASPRPFVEHIVRLRGWPVQKVVGTELPTRDGIITGHIGTECAWHDKARLLTIQLGQSYTHYQVTAAYGNLPVDRPMLAMAKRRFAVIRGRVREL